MPETHPFIAPSFRGKHLTLIDARRREQKLGYNQLAELAGLERHLVVKALVGGPTSTDFATLVALANAVGHDLWAPLAAQPQGALAG
jgi:hypothetical protein